MIHADVTAELISFLAAGVSELTSADRRLNRLRELIHRVTLYALPAPSKFRLDITLDLAVRTSDYSSGSTLGANDVVKQAIDLMAYNFSSSRESSEKE